MEAKEKIMPKYGNSFYSRPMGDTDPLISKLTNPKRNRVDKHRNILRLKNIKAT